MKKFYNLVSYQKAADGYHILLDGRPVKTPAKTDLQAPSESLAGKIVQEWAAQIDEIIPDTMPLTQILTTAQDRVAREREAMQVAVLKYLDTDLVCYPADKPEALAAAQEAAWKPIRIWFEKYFGVALKTTSGLAALEQEAAAHKAAAYKVEGLSDNEFTVLQLVTSLSGSLVIALAFQENEITPDDVLKAIFVEEDYQGKIYDAEKYGDDPVLAKKRKSAACDLNAARDYLAAL